MSHQVSDSEVVTPGGPQPETSLSPPRTGADQALSPSLQRARKLVLAHGWNSTAYQLLNPGMSLWFSEDADAVVGFVEASGVCVVAGAPVCPAGRLEATAAVFEQHARQAGMSVCYFCAESRLHALYEHSPVHRTVCLGAQPAWQPRGWPAIIDRHASLRAQLHRATNKGVRVEEWRPDEAGADPRLRDLLQQWLQTRGLPPLHFLVEPDTLSRILDRRIFVAQRSGNPIAFLVASPIPARDGYLIEQIVRGASAPNGASELLVDAAMRAVAASGAAYVTLGLAPLSRHAPPSDLDQPFWLAGALGWMRAHGRRFYNFDGLDSFKAKMRPDQWEPVFAIAAGTYFSPRTLYAITGAFSGTSTVSLVARALARAAAQDAGGLIARARGWR